MGGVAGGGGDTSVCWKDMCRRNWSIRFNHNLWNHFNSVCNYSSRMRIIPLSLSFLNHSICEEGPASPFFFFFFFFFEPSIERANIHRERERERWDLMHTDYSRDPLFNSGRKRQLKSFKPPINCTFKQLINTTQPLPPGFELSFV